MFPLTLRLTPTAAQTRSSSQSQVTGLTADLAAKVPTTRTVNGHQLTGDITVTKGNVGLGNVTDDVQLKAADLDTDAGADSEQRYQGAVAESGSLLRRRQRWSGR